MSATPASRSSVATSDQLLPDALCPSGAFALSETPTVSCANAGDHGLIYDLLVATGNAPSREDFLASQDDPHYEPSDRLLVRLGQRVVGHLQVSRRVMQLDGVTLPVAQLRALAVLPEYRAGACTALLLREAERLMREDGTLVALVETRSPDRFRQFGWVDCGPRHYMRAGAREIRAFLSSQTAPRGPRRTLSTRMWRHVELRQLTQLYEQATSHATGPFERSEDYWHWLISRQAYDQILVAIEGNDTLEFGDQAPRIVGFAVTGNACLVELVAEADDADVVRHLLVRACREAIEHDHHTLRVLVPPSHFLGTLMAEAGATRSTGAEFDGEHTMAKVLDPLALVGRLFPRFQERARASGIPRPSELSLELDDAAYQFVLSRRSSRLSPDQVGRVDMRARGASFPALLLGQCDVEAAQQSDQLKFRNKAVARVVQTLFPRIDWWRPVLDDLRA